MKSDLTESSTCLRNKSNWRTYFTDIFQGTSAGGRARKDSFHFPRVTQYQCVHAFLEALALSTLNLSHLSIIWPNNNKEG